ncbi:conserved hypothetical protein [Methylocella silvestris BL2]|uniref:DUF6129 domain-containing protein n=1 Tax=Methylocella silvestris (strain DSM 15510 / CIP 108128 / LMG 27833 / NCIMB 13906 / BL2) TaxID=395965 RepID=B8EJ31_METSB|nr:DUF6129 family protein [Methylocella silvestris]ACK52523.1 conserved hypothetical protein [Methylocella silvestris BL2]
MTLDEQSLGAISAFLATAELDPAALAELRRRFPGLPLSRCDASDVADETPYRSFERCNLYLLDGRDHCVKLTTDPSCATGVVLASKGAR